jgi:hypothetical protein
LRLQARNVERERKRDFGMTEFSSKSSRLQNVSQADWDLARSRELVLLRLAESPSPLPSLAKEAALQLGLSCSSIYRLLRRYECLRAATAFLARKVRAHLGTKTMMVCRARRILEGQSFWPDECTSITASRSLVRPLMQEKESLADSPQVVRNMSPRASPCVMLSARPLPHVMDERVRVSTISGQF